MKNLAILGSTGSIGESTFDLATRFSDRFSVLALAAGGFRVERLAEQVRGCGAKLVAVHQEGQADRLRSLLDDHVEVCWGIEGLVRVAGAPGVDLVVSAIVGAAGLVPTYTALLEGRDVAVANKETLVVAGELVMEAARNTGARIIPVDSEHSALFQVLEGRKREEVRNLILTASGGPFRGWKTDKLEKVAAREALVHPNWSMGPKITVDSATLMNKGLEVIEAHWLFGIPSNRICVTIHPQSVVHSIVEFVDGSMMAQLGVADMRVPISYALGYPERLPMEEFKLDLWALKALTFEPPDRGSFPCLDLAYRAIECGGNAPAVLSGSNEVAVEAFLAAQIHFLQIPEVVAAALDAHEPRRIDSIHTALEVDRWARRFASDWVARWGRRN